MPLPVILIVQFIVADWVCCPHGFGVWPHLSSFRNVAPHRFTLLVSAVFFFTAPVVFLSVALTGTTVDVSLGDF